MTQEILDVVAADVALVQLDSSAQLVLELNESQAVTLVAFHAEKVADLVDLDGYRGMGFVFGKIRSASTWWIGDWLARGTELYGEEFSQLLEATPEERYSLLDQVTGHDPDTLKRWARVCDRIAPARRRLALSFSHHEAVSALEPDDQERWLALAEAEGMTADAVRRGIREEKGQAAPPLDGMGREPGRSRGEMIEDAAALCWAQGTLDSEGWGRVPPEAWAQLGAALGHD